MNQSLTNKEGRGSQRSVCSHCIHFLFQIHIGGGWSGANYRDSWKSAARRPTTI